MFSPSCGLTKMYTLSAHNQCSHDIPKQLSPRTQSLRAKGQQLINLRSESQIQELVGLVEDQVAASIQGYPRVGASNVTRNPTQYITISPIIYSIKALKSKLTFQACLYVIPLLVRQDDLAIVTPMHK